MTLYDDGGRATSVTINLQVMAERSKEVVNVGGIRGALSLVLGLIKCLIKPKLVRIGEKLNYLIIFKLFQNLY